jgi:hypothetical protein
MIIEHKNLKFSICFHATPLMVACGNMYDFEVINRPMVLVAYYVDISCNIILPYTATECYRTVYLSF